MEEKKFHNSKNKKFSSIAWIMAVLVIVIAVILNMIVSQLDLGWDVSPNKQYSLGKTTTAYLDDSTKTAQKLTFMCSQRWMTSKTAWIHWHSIGL